MTMYFDPKSNMPDLETLTDFIETRVEFCTDDALKKGLADLVNVLEHNPEDLLKIITNSMMPAIFMFMQLVEKMKKGECVEKLELLNQARLEQWIDACIYNVYDLERFAHAAPDYLARALAIMVSKDEYRQRFFNSDDEPTIVQKLQTFCSQEQIDTFKAYLSVPGQEHQVSFQ